MPFEDEDEFRPLARYGFNGLTQSSNHLFAASFNAVYAIRKSDLGLDYVISNSLMNDLHGIAYFDNSIFFICTGLDTLVQMSLDGRIVQTWTVEADLSVTHSLPDSSVDWRFVTKQRSGPLGRFHFNFVRPTEDGFWLTSRNLSSVVVVAAGATRAHLVSLSQFTPVLIHDGKRFGDFLYFTSVDGKILKANLADPGAFSPWEVVPSNAPFRYGLTTELQRLSATALNREPNWCRGIHVEGGIRYVTIDGRYGTDLSFGLLGVTEQGEVQMNERFSWTFIDESAATSIRHVTGFDIQVI